MGRIDPATTWWNTGWHRSAIGDDTLLDWWPYIYPLKGLPENYLELEEFAPLRELVQITNDDLRTFDVVYTDGMDTIRRVRDGKILPVEGRFLTLEDSENKNPVCVVSDVFMKEYGLSLGDKVKLKLGDELFEQYAPLGAVASCRGRYANKFVDAEFEIVGSYVDVNIQKLREIDLYWAYSDNTIFVPLSFLPVEESELNDHEFKPGEISFVVGDARNIRPFVEECIPKLEEMGLTVYFSDGGWLRIEEQVKQAGSLSLSKLLAFGAACVLASALTVYLFIGRKKREYAIMRALGTTKAGANRSLFVPLVLLAVIAVALGGAAATVYSGQNVVNTLREFVELGLEVDPSVPLPVSAYGILGELVLVVILASYGLQRLGKKPPLMLLQENTNRDAKSEKKKSKFDAVESGLPAAFSRQSLQNAIMPEKGREAALKHVLRYVARHGRRAMAKSLLAILLAALLATALGQFTAVRKTYGDLYRNIEIKARFVNGMPYSRAVKVAESGYVHSPYYEYIVKEAEINFKFTELCVTNDLSRHTNAPIELLEGYDKDTVMTQKEKLCVVTGGLMDSLGIELGDVVEIHRYNHLWDIMYNYPEYTEQEALEVYHRQSVDCRVVGRIETESLGDIVFVPVDAELYFRSVINPFLLDLAEYTLGDYHQAEEFRTYAKETVDSVRTAPPVFLMDTSEADNIYKIYRLIETLYPIAAVVAVVIGGVLPGLIILQSAKEASILRVLGTTKRRTRIMLISEQLILCLLGLVLAFIILSAINGNSILTVVLPLSIYIVLHFAGCIIGTSICAVVVTRRRILELLQVRE